LFISPINASPTNYGPPRRCVSCLPDPKVASTRLNTSGCRTITHTSASVTASLSQHLAAALFRRIRRGTIPDEESRCHNRYYSSVLDESHSSNCLPHWRLKGRVCVAAADRERAVKPCWRIPGNFFGTSLSRLLAFLIGRCRDPGRTLDTC
jgi:hypothetical protein